MAARKKAAPKAARKPTRKAVAKAPASAKSKVASPKSPRAAVAAPQRKKVVKAAVKAEKPAPRQRALKADPQTETEALARKIVTVTTENTVERHIAELYTDDCTSQEVDGQIAQGLEGIRAKLETWGEMVESSSFTARHVLVHKNVIAIEWEGEVKLRDGRSLTLSEMAIHEARDGKIAAERYYYDPAVLGGPQPEPEPLPPVKPPRGTPPLDPMDL